MANNAELQDALRQANDLAGQGRFAEAETHYARARALSPEDLHVLIGHGHVLRLLGRAAEARAVALQHLGRTEEALSAYRKVVADNPAHLTAHQDLNHMLYRLKRDEEFLRSYDQAAARMPDVPHFAIAKAELLLRAGRPQEADASYDQALRLAPGYPLAMQGKAGALLK